MVSMCKIFAALPWKVQPIISEYECTSRNGTYIIQRLPSAIASNPHQLRVLATESGTGALRGIINDLLDGGIHPQNSQCRIAMNKTVLKRFHPISPSCTPSTT